MFHHLHWERMVDDQVTKGMEETRGKKIDLRGKRLGEERNEEEAH